MGTIDGKAEDLQLTLKLVRKLTCLAAEIELDDTATEDWLLEALCEFDQVRRQAEADHRIIEEERQSMDQVWLELMGLARRSRAYNPQVQAKLETIRAAVAPRRLHKAA